ncbi:MAG: glycogen-binding domain-containing protein [bacterium]|nr:glycogen-binding domain-containing protein [bacterium]
MRKRVYFKLENQEAEHVALAGSFNEWDPEARVLKRGEEGVWRTFLSLEPGVYQYRFVVDGQWQNDPEASVVSNPFGTTNNVRMVG